MRTRSAGILQEKQRAAKASGRAESVRIKYLVSQLRKVENENGQLKLELGVLRRNSSNQRSVVSESLVADNSTLRTDVDKAKFENQKLLGVVAYLQHKVEEAAQFESENTRMTNRLVQLEHDNARLVAGQDQLRKSCDALTQENSIYRDTQAAAEQEALRQKGRETRLSDRLAQLTVENEEYGGKYDRLNRCYAMLTIACGNGQASYN
jgi:chromosome segregation ATPase